MIEIIAEGPVETDEETSVDRRDGWDPIQGRVTATRRQTVRVHLELPQGHVDLQGFAPSQFHWSIAEVYGRYVDGPIDSNRFRFPEEEWSVEFRGEWFDWIQAAHRYQVERPDDSLIDILGRFGSWEETPTRTIAQAVDHADGVPGAYTAPAETIESEYRKFEERLRSFDARINIPESYRPEQEA